MADASTTQLQVWIDLMNSGDRRKWKPALNGLIQNAGDRLLRLTRKMLRDYSRLRRWVESGDVLQNALIRLDRALRSETPASVKAFFDLATLQIRRELMDLARQFFGPQGLAANHETSGRQKKHEGALPPRYDRGVTKEGPSEVAAWHELEELIAGLPEEERAVFNLRWYHGLEHAEAAAVLGVSVPTVKRRWQEVRSRLGKILKAAESGE
jgi:RNA polymerase sigma factor (sigma-70 family)